MLSNIMYKFSVFGDFTQLKYTSENIKNMLDIKSEKVLLPNVISQLGVSGSVEQRIQLVSVDHTVTLSVLQERIDVEIYSDKQEGFHDEDVKKTMDELRSIMGQIYNVFSDDIPMATRIAMITSYVYFDISDEEKIRFRNRFVNDIGFYKDTMTDEFFIDLVGNVTYNMNNRDEMVNAITMIKRLFPSAGIGVDGPVDGYQVDFDINTVPKNKKNRFAPDVYEEFFKQFEDTVSSLRVDILDGCE